MMGSLTPTSGLASNFHLWVCSFGHFSSNWSRLHFPSNPFWNGDFHSRCSLLNAFGKEESRVRQKNLNCSTVATEVPASRWGPSGARWVLQDQLQAARTHGQSWGTVTGCNCLDRDSGVSAQQHLPCTVGSKFLPLLPGGWCSDFSAVR